MADEPDEVDRAEWLLEPPGAGEIRLVVELGDGAELTPEAQATLEQLMSEIQDAEVSGFRRGPSIGANVGIFGGIRLDSTCDKLVCGKHSCDKHVCDVYKSTRYF